MSPIEVTFPNGAAFCFMLMMAAPAGAASLTGAPFGATADGKPVTRYTMSARSGVGVSFMSYGGIVLDVAAPDRQGRPGHVVLGFSTLRDYETTGAQGELYFGALLGRYANWIGRGRFSLDGHDYQLTLSDPPNTMHGGKKGFDKQVWAVQPLVTSSPNVGARLTYTSVDREEGYPGKLKVDVTYTLSDDGAFTIHDEATTDRDTVINLSNHMNFNLAGAGSPGGALQQVLTVEAKDYLPLDQAQLPLGQVAPVAGTLFDFRHPTAIGFCMHDKNAQLTIANGYDQCWVLDKQGGSAQPQHAVHAVDLASGRTLDCYTTEPGV